MTCARSSQQQRRLWQLRRARGQAAGLLRAAAVVEGGIDPKALRAAILGCVRAHPLLRTRYRWPPVGGFPTSDALPESAAGDVVLELPIPHEAQLDRYFAGLFDGQLDAERAQVLTYGQMSVPGVGELLLLSLPADYADAATQDNLFSEILGRMGSNAWRPPPALAYAEYCELAERLAGSEAARAGADFWARCWWEWGRRLERTDPGVHERTVNERSKAQRSCRVIPERLASALSADADRRGYAVEAGLLSAWLLLVRRLAGDGPVGVYCDGRSEPEFQASLGLFARYLPVGLRWRPGLSVCELAPLVNDEWLEARAWQDCFCWPPMEAAAGASGYQFGFTALDVPSSRTPGAARVTRRLELEPFAVELVVDRNEFGLGHRLEIWSSVLDRSEASAWCEEYLRTLEHWLQVDPPSSTRRAPSRLEPSLRRGAAGDLAAAAGSGTDPEPFVSAIARRAAIHPDRIAVVSDEGQFTYRELNRQANRLARLLLARGVKPEQGVAICCERSLEAMVAFLGVCKAGAACFPLEPRDAPERRVRLTRAAGLSVAVCQRRYASEIRAGLDDVIEFESALGLLAVDAPRTSAGEQGDDADLPCDPLPGSLAYVLHTSGTTGEPLACMVEHRSLAHLASALGTAAYAGLERPIRVAVNGSLAFDTSVKQWLQLAAGATLVMVSDAVRYDAEAMVEQLEMLEVEALDVTPAHLELLSRAGFVATPPRSLSRVLVGGDSIGERAWSILGKSARPCYFNVYGPTECTVDSTLTKIADHETESLGRALPGVELYVTDRIQELAPVGVTGELLIGGLGVGRGYHRRADVTAERFLPDVWGGQAGSRLYRTGDLVLSRPGGHFDFQGRREGRLKIRGHRVDPHELRAVLEEHPAVAVARVLTVREQDRSTLHAFVVPIERMAPCIRGKRRHRLPNGLAILDLNKNETEFLYRDIFERRAYFRHGLGIRAGDVVFDVGANIGLFTLCAHLAAPGVQIHSFEPNPAAFTALRENVRLYRVKAELYPLALSDRPGEGRFLVYPALSTLSGYDALPKAERETLAAFVRNEALQAGAGAPSRYADALAEVLADRVAVTPITVRAQTLASIMQERAVQTIHLLKINVEKSEERVLAGIDARTWPKIQQVVLEVHDIDGRLDRICSLLRGRGFEVDVDEDWSLGAGAQTNYYVYSRRREHPAAPPEPTPWLPLEEPFLQAADVRAFIEQRLPAEALPTTIHVIEAFPLTPNNKPDMEVLADMARRNERSVRAPRGAVELCIAEAWKTALGISEIPVDRSFFDLGGDSFRLVEVKELLAKSLGRDVRVVDLFQHPTVESLANFLSAGAVAGSGEAVGAELRAEKRQAALGTRNNQRRSARRANSEE